MGCVRVLNVGVLCSACHPPPRALHTFQSIQVVFRHLANARSPHQARTGKLGTGAVDEANEERRYGLEKEEVRQDVTAYHGSEEQYVFRNRFVVLGSSYP